MKRGLLQVARAADVARERATEVLGEGRAGNHDADRLDVAAGRGAHHALPAVITTRWVMFGVRRGCSAGDRQRLFERADLHVGVHRRRKARLSSMPSRMTVANPDSRT